MLLQKIMWRFSLKSNAKAKPLLAIGEISRIESVKVEREEELFLNKEHDITTGSKYVIQDK